MKIKGVEIKDSEIFRFWSCAVTSDTTECLNWIGAKDKDGYGNFHFGKKRVRANRFAYAVSFEDFREDLLVCHHCDNPSCVNPEHLFQGSVSDNNWDKSRKGRAYRPIGDLHYTRNDPSKIRRGEQLVWARLKEPQVIQIKKILRDGGKTQDQIAAIFGVCRPLISLISSGKRWSHVSI